MFCFKKKQTQKSSNIDFDALIAQLERTKKINDDMLTMSMDFTKQTNRRLKEVKR